MEKHKTEISKVSGHLDFPFHCDHCDNHPPSNLCFICSPCNPGTQSSSTTFLSPDDNNYVADDDDDNLYDAAEDDNNAADDDEDDN